MQQYFTTYEVACYEQFLLERTLLDLCVSFSFQRHVMRAERHM